MSILFPKHRPQRAAVGGAAFALALLLVSGPALAQQTVTQATVSGRVEDTSGAAVADAPVLARSLERGLSFSTTTDTHGRYRFLYLPADTYELRVERAPFRPAVTPRDAHRGPGRRCAASACSSKERQSGRRRRRGAARRDRAHPGRGDRRPP